MNKSRFVFSATSVADLQRINGFYSSINHKVLKLAFDRLMEAFDVIDQFPNIGRTLVQKSGTREFVVPFGEGNFFIRYRTIKSKIQIAHIWHSLEDES